MKLIYFRKTNAQKREGKNGIKFYQLEYEAEIEFQEDCKWLTDMLHIFDNTHSSFKTAPVQKQAESEGEFWGGWLNSTTQPGEEYKKGARVKFPGLITFEKAEKGWRPVHR